MSSGTSTTKPPSYEKPSPTANDPQAKPLATERSAKVARMEAFLTGKKPQPQIDTDWRIDPNSDISESERSFQALSKLVLALGWSQLYLGEPTQQQKNNAPTIITGCLEEFMAYYEKLATSKEGKTYINHYLRPYLKLESYAMKKISSALEALAEEASSLKQVRKAEKLRSIQEFLAKLNKPAV